MKILIVFAMIAGFLFAGCDCPPCPERGDICIAALGNHAKVDWRELVCGEVADPKAQVKLVIHPTATTQYWVQPNVIVGKNGKWEVRPYFGDAGAKYKENEDFEVRAFANPKQQLKEGDILADWPEAEWTSPIVRVARK